MTTARWYLVTKSLFGKSDGLYHWVDPQTRRTACGWSAYGLHVSEYQSYNQRRRARCSSCIMARGVP